MSDSFKPSERTQFQPRRQKSKAVVEATPEHVVTFLTGAAQVNSPCINCPEYQAALREIERLTALHEAAAARAELAQIDNERLRAALQDIAEDPYAVDGGAAEVARAALESKP